MSDDIDDLLGNLGEEDDCDDGCTCSECTPVEQKIAACQSMLADILEDVAELRRNVNSKN